MASAISDLPGIVSIIKLSDFYQISIDDLLKGDKKMTDKNRKGCKSCEE